MTVREACDHEFFSRPNDGKDLHLNTCLHMFPTDSFIGQSIARKLKRRDDRSLDASFHAIREERAQRMTAQKKRYRCVKHEVYTTNGIASCSRCDASENEILDAVLDPLLEEDEQDIHHELHVHTCTKCFENEPCSGDCTIEPDLGTTNTGIPKGSHIRCAACGPEPEEPEPPRVMFREDICRNDGPLLPPFEAGDVTDRVTVIMLYPQIGRGDWEFMTRVRCSIAPHSRPLLNSEWSINANDPRGHALRWSISNNNKAWQEIARTTLRFDLAVRTGEFLAVAAYGLILFALSVNTEHERTRVRAVMRAVREASEGE